MILRARVGLHPFANAATGRQIILGEPRGDGLQMNVDRADAQPRASFAAEMLGDLSPVEPEPQQLGDLPLPRSQIIQAQRMRAVIQLARLHDSEVG